METKVCNKCGKEKPISEFSKNSRKRDGLQTACKECMAEYNRLHYQKNKEIYSAKAKENIREYIHSIKSQLKCSVCGEDRYWCLDFHHTNPSEKEYNISSLVRDGSRQKIEEELKKCIVLIATEIYTTRIKRLVNKKTYSKYFDYSSIFWIANINNSLL